MAFKILSDEPAQHSSFKIKKIIAVAAGKGGVGKSTVAVNLALSLKQQGWVVGLLDADVYGPSILQMLPKGILPCQDPENPVQILPGITLGIKIISTAHFRNENEAAIVRAPVANSIISQFLQQVNWGDLDFLIIDFPPGTGDIQLTLMQQAAISGALIVTTPQEVALIDVRKSIQMFQKLQIPLLGVVENMSFFKDPKTAEKHFPFGSGGGKKLAAEFNIQFLGEIPIEPFLSKCGDLGESIFSCDPSGSAALFFDGLGLEVQKDIGNFGEEGLKTFSLLWKSDMGKASDPLAPLERKEQKGPVFIRKIKQRDDETFTIEWTDNLISVYHLKELQKQCPCASCQSLKNSSSTLSAIQISSVGRYALKVTFTTGCSKGIYTFLNLRKLAAC